MEARLGSFFQGIKLLISNRIQKMSIPLMKDAGLIGLKLYFQKKLMIGICLSLFILIHLTGVIMNTILAAN